MKKILDNYYYFMYRWTIMHPLHFLFYRDGHKFLYTNHPKLDRICFLILQFIHSLVAGKPVYHIKLLFLKVFKKNLYI